MNAYELLSEPIRRQIWEWGWESLTSIQERAIPAILQGSSHVILAAGTASGKTEAAFLPILSSLGQRASAALKVLYVSPLKALINNQFERITPLCQNLGIPLGRWHGDVGQGSKQRFLANPGGILQITPESLESLFVNRPEFVDALFGELEFIVVDEVHAFIGTARGVHLRSLLDRASRLSAHRVRLVALSATLGDPGTACGWVSSNVGEVDVVEDKDSDKVLLSHLMYIPSLPGGEIGKGVFEDIRSLTESQKAIIFCNSRVRVEEVTFRLNQLAGWEQYLPHHSSIDKAQREYVEQRMASGAENHSVVATSTLELGLDIGDVDLVVQLDSTYSVASLKQRLGRSGRRSSHQVLQLYATSPDHLLQSVAVMELMRQRWVEATPGYPLPYDVLVQQLISICAQHHGLSLEDLIRAVIENKAFADLEADQVFLVIQHLAAKGFLEMIQGRDEVIVGLEGARLMKKQDFYVMFEAQELYQVFHGTRPVGTFTKEEFLGPGDCLMLSGRLWQVVSLDQETDRCFVEPAASGEAVLFSGSGGAITQPLATKMQAILYDQDIYPYLDPAAASCLEELRSEYETRGGSLQHRFLYQDGNSYVFETFAATEMARTLEKMLSALGATVTRRDVLGRIYFYYDGNIRRLMSQLWAFPESLGRSVSQSETSDGAAQPKYLHELPNEIQRQVREARQVSVSQVRDFLRALKWKLIHGYY